MNWRRSLYWSGTLTVTGKRGGDRPLSHGPGLSQELPADQRTAEGEKRLVDVGPLVVTHAEAAKLIQPGKRTLDHPPPPAQAAAVHRATPRDERANPTRAQPAPNGLCVVAPITEHTVRSPPRSPAFA